jgi:hypothetical protein
MACQDPAKSGFFSRETLTVLSRVEATQRTQRAAKGRKEYHNLD